MLKPEKWFRYGSSGSSDAHSSRNRCRAGRRLRLDARGPGCGRGPSTRCRSAPAAARRCRRARCRSRSGSSRGTAARRRREAPQHAPQHGAAGDGTFGSRTRHERGLFRGGRQCRRLAGPSRRTRRRWSRSRAASRDAEAVSANSSCSTSSIGLSSLPARGRRA